MLTGTNYILGSVPFDFFSGLNVVSFIQNVIAFANGILEIYAIPIGIYEVDFTFWRNIYGRIARNFDVLRFCRFSRCFSIVDAPIKWRAISNGNFRLAAYRTRILTAESKDRHHKDSNNSDAK